MTFESVLNCAFSVNTAFLTGFYGVPDLWYTADI